MKTRKITLLIGGAILVALATFLSISRYLHTKPLRTPISIMAYHAALSYTEVYVLKPNYIHESYKLSDYMNDDLHGMRPHAASYRKCVLPHEMSAKDEPLDSAKDPREEALNLSSIAVLDRGCKRPSPKGEGFEERL